MASSSARMVKIGSIPSTFVGTPTFGDFAI
jgi:hypothetical protein